MRIPIRFSIQYVLIAIACVAVALTALRYASDFWEGVFYFLVVVFLFSTLLGCIYRKGHLRAGWVGAALFGWLFLVMLQTPWFQNYAATPLYHVWYGGYKQMVKLYTPAEYAGQPVLVGNDGEAESYLVIQDRRSIVRVSLGTFVPRSEDVEPIAKLLSIFIMAFIGSLIGRYFYATRERLCQSSQ